jgi:transposase InsO family protein
MASWLTRVEKAYDPFHVRKACSPDNAACEGFFGRLKTEMFYPRDWRSTTHNSLRRLMPTFAGTTKSVLKCP